MDSAASVDNSRAQSRRTEASKQRELPTAAWTTRATKPSHKKRDRGRGLPTLPTDPTTFFQGKKPGKRSVMLTAWLSSNIYLPYQCNVVIRS